MTEQLADYQAILERVRAAEKQSANVKALGLVALIVALVAVVLHVPGELGFRKGTGLLAKGGALEAEKIVVKDSGGKPRIVLTAERDRPALTVYDAKGTTQIAVVTVTSGTEQSMLSFFDSNGKRRIELGAWVKGELNFNDKSGKNAASFSEWGGEAHLMLGRSEGPSVSISAGSSQYFGPEAHMRISDGSGDPLRGVPLRGVIDLGVGGMSQDARLKISGKSGPTIDMSAGELGRLAKISISEAELIGDISKMKLEKLEDFQAAKSKVKLGCAINLTAITGIGPSLILSDTQGKPLVDLSAMTEIGASVTLSDTEGKARAVLGTTGLVDTKTGEETKTAPSSLVLFDKDGKVLWQAPK